MKMDHYGISHLSTNADHSEFTKSVNVRLSVPFYEEVFDDNLPACPGLTVFIFVLWINHHYGFICGRQNKERLFT